MNSQAEEVMRRLLGAATEARPMAGGRSGASLWLVDNRYVLRQSAPQGLLPVEWTRQQKCLELASQRGLAPPILYARDGISVMEWVEGSPIGRPTPREGDPLGRLAALLRHLHTGPAFPEGPSLAEMFADLRRNLPDLPEVLGERMAECAPRLEALGSPAPCHLDLNSSNILASPSRIYLVDWELACQNEPYLDLAQLGVWVCRDQAERETLLERYLERAPGPLELERMRLARVLALCFYASAFHLVARMQDRAWVKQGPDLDGIFAEMADTGQRFRPEAMAHALMLELENAGK